MVLHFIWKKVFDQPTSSHSSIPARNPANIDLPWLGGPVFRVQPLGMPPSLFAWRGQPTHWLVFGFTRPEHGASDGGVPTQGTRRTATSDLTECDCPVSCFTYGTCCNTLSQSIFVSNWFQSYVMYIYILGCFPYTHMLYPYKTNYMYNICV